MDKPRLRRIGTVWYCEHGGDRGIGLTPLLAFVSYRNSRRLRMLRALRRGAAEVGRA